MSPLIFVTPKRHILAWFRVFWVITRQNRSKGLTCGLFPEKKVYVRTYVRTYVKIIQRYISPICPEAPRQRICTKIGIAGRLAYVINCDNFFWQSVQGFGFCRGPKFAISHWLSRSPLTQCWRYRAARDLKQSAAISVNWRWLSNYGWYNSSYSVLSEITGCVLRPKSPLQYSLTYPSYPAHVMFIIVRYDTATLIILRHISSIVLCHPSWPNIGLLHFGPCDIEMKIKPEYIMSVNASVSDVPALQIWWP